MLLHVLSTLWADPWVFEVINPLEIAIKNIILLWKKLSNSKIL